jgi:hypothetical protein
VVLVAGEVFDGNDMIWVDILHGLMVCNCFLLLTTTVFFWLRHSLGIIGFVFLWFAPYMRNKRTHSSCPELGTSARGVCLVSKIPLHRIFSRPTGRTRLGFISANLYVESQRLYLTIQFESVVYICYAVLLHLHV